MSVLEKQIMEGYRYARYVMQKEDDHVAKRTLVMKVNVNVKRGRPKKIRMGCVKEDMPEKVLSAETTYYDVLSRPLLHHR